MKESAIRQNLIDIILTGSKIMPDIFPKADFLSLCDLSTKELFTSVRYIVDWMEENMPDQPVIIRD